MKKLDLDMLVVESFATLEVQQVRGTVEGQQATAPWPLFTCWNTCEYTCKATCPPSCRDTDCVTACQGGGHLSTNPECVQME